MSLGKRRVAVLRVALEPGRGGLQQREAVQSAEHMADVAVGDHDGGAGFLSLAYEGVVVATPVDGDPLPGVALGGPPPARDPVERAGEVIGKAQQEILGDPMPPRASANTVFFCVSVGTTWLLSPERWAAAKSPRSCDVTLRSSISWRGSSRVTFTTRTSALPYLVGTQDDAHQLPRYVE